MIRRSGEILNLSNCWSPMFWLLLSCCLVVYIWLIGPKCFARAGSKVFFSLVESVPGLRSPLPFTQFCMPINLVTNQKIGKGNSKVLSSDFTRNAERYLIYPKFRKNSVSFFLTRKPGILASKSINSDLLLGAVHKLRDHFRGGRGLWNDDGWWRYGWRRLQYDDIITFLVVLNCKFERPICKGEEI